MRSSGNVVAACHGLTIQKHDLLILRAPCSRIGIQTKPLERAIEKRSLHRDLGLAAAHPVIECNDLLLRLRQIRVMPDLQCQLGRWRSGIMCRRGSYTPSETG